MKKNAVFLFLLVFSIAVIFVLPVLLDAAGPTEFTSNTFASSSVLAQGAASE